MIGFLCLAIVSNERRQNVATKGVSTLSSRCLALREKAPCNPASANPTQRKSTHSDLPCAPRGSLSYSKEPAIRARTVGVSTMKWHSLAVQAARYMSVVFLGQLHSSMLIPSRVQQLRLAQQTHEARIGSARPGWEAAGVSKRRPVKSQMAHNCLRGQGCSSALCPFFATQLATAGRRDARRATCLQPLIEVTTPTTQRLHVTCTSLCTHTGNSPTSSALQTTCLAPLTMFTIWNPIIPSRSANGTPSMYSATGSTVPASELRTTSCA